MAERRQATRREPIEIEIREQVFVAEPLDWRTAGDFGNEIVRQNVSAMNDAVRMYVDGNTPQLEMRLSQKIQDWDSLFALAFPKNKLTEFVGFDVDESATLILAALEVNHLEHLNHLVDPNSRTPMLPGGTDTSGENPLTLIGQKTESSPDSSLPESPETPSSA